MNINLAWRIVIFIVAIILSLIVVPFVASLATNAISFLGENITALFRPFTLSGDARLEGLVTLCLYLVFFVILLKFFARR